MRFEAIRMLLATMLCARSAVATVCVAPKWTIQNNDDLHVVLGKESAEFCSKYGAEKQNAEMNEKCEKFCRVDKTNVGLPIQLGSSIFGMKLDEMTKVCQALADPNFEVAKQCNIKSKALLTMEVRMSQLLERIEVFKAKQVTFKAQQLDETKKLQDDLKSDKFAEEMRKTNNDDKPSKLRGKFNAFVQAQTTGASKELIESMQSVKEASLALKTTMAADLPKFLEFVKDCNKMLLGKTADAKALLDVCTQEGTSCVQDKSASHVGCCCGINPVTADSLEIDGITHFRRLDDSTVTTDESIEVCAQAMKRVRNTIASEEKKVKDTYQQESLLKENMARLQRRYPSYYTQCYPQKRRLKSFDLKEEKQRLKSFDLEEKVWHQNSHPRKLVDLACSPRPVQGAENTDGSILKVALSDKLEKSMCSEPPVVSNDKMRDICDKFCAPKGVPVLLGSTTYGVNLNGSNSVCLEHFGGVLKHDPALLKQCGKWSRSFVDIEVKAAGMVKYLHVFRAVKDEYRAVLAKDIRGIQEYSVSDEYKQKIKKALNTPQEQIDMILERLKSDESKVMEKRLGDAISDLKQATQDLASTLESKFVDLESFLKQCGEFFIGQGAQDEYLLDICIQKGEACVGADTEKDYPTNHATCCCGYHPFSSFGEINRVTINGITSVPAPGRVPQRRRLDVVEPPDFMDICASGWTDAGAAVGEIYSRMKKSTKAWEIIEETQRKLKEKYGEDYCVFEAGQVIKPSIPDPAKPGGVNPTEAADAHGVYSFTGLLFSMLILGREM